MYLFSNKEFDKEKEDIIKDILYVIYMFSFYYERIKTIEKMYQLLKEINDIEDIDNLLNNDSNLQYVYQLFPISEDILQENKKAKYQLYLLELKNLILNTNINDILYFMKIKNDVEELYEKIYNNTVSQQELNILNNELDKKLKYLEKYISAADIEAYKMYFKIKNNESSNFAVNIGIKLFEIAKGKLKFSELKQLEELKNKTDSTEYLKFNCLEKLKIEKEESNQIRMYAVKKILKGVIEFVIFYLLIGRVSDLYYENFIDTKNIYMLIPICIWIFIVMLYIIYFSSYLFVILKSKMSSNIKGIIGFVADIYWNSEKHSKRFYKVYFPKCNAQYHARTTHATHVLERKSMVKLVKIANKKIIVPMNDNI